MKKKISATRVIVLLSAALTFAFSQTATPVAAKKYVLQSEQPPLPDDSVIQTGGQAELADAELVAKARGITIESALARGRASKLIGDVQAKLLSQPSLGSGGVWVENDKAFVLHVGLKNLKGTAEADSLNTIKSQVQEGLKDAKGIDSIVYHVVPYTQDELFQAQTVLRESNNDNKLALVSYIDTTSNSVKVMGTREVLDTLERSVDKSKLPIAFDEAAGKPIFNFVAAEAPPTFKDTNEVLGGWPLADCTSSFTVAWGDGSTDKRRMLTAGHCQDAATLNGVPLEFKGQYLGAIYDFQWHAATNYPTNYVRNFVYIGGGTNYRPMTSQIYLASTYIGMPTCRYGKSTGNHCEGSILSIGLYLVDLNGTAFWGMNGTTPAAAFYGDSGGPVYYNNSAIAVLKGVYTLSGYTYEVSMPLERIAVQGLYLVTWYP